MSTKHIVDELHLLSVGEEIPVVQRQMSCNFTRRVLGEWNHRFLTLVLERGLGGGEGRGVQWNPLTHKSTWGPMENKGSEDIQTGS